MSAIPISQIVNVQIGTTPSAPERQGFASLLFITTENVPQSPAEGIKYYFSQEDVAADWAPTSEVYKASLNYYSPNPRPQIFAVGQKYTAAQSGALIGGGLAESDVLVWQAITDGSFSVSVDGSASADITGMDFSGDAALTDVAATIQTALAATFTGVTCTYDSTSNRFTITSGTAGNASSVSYLQNAATGTNIVELLQGQQGAATKYSGIDVEASVQSSLNRLENAGGWYFFALDKSMRDTQDVLDAAAWAQTRIKQFFALSNNPDSKDPSISTDQGSQLNAAGYTRTFSMFSDYPEEYPEVGAAGKAATVDFEFPNSALTLAYKELPGVTPEGLTTAELTTLENKGVVAYISFRSSANTNAGNQQTVNGLSNSYMAAGSPVWQDTIHGVDWLQNAIETNVFTYIKTRPTKVPLTDEGGVALESQVILALDQGVGNGLIAESGVTSEGVFLPNGYDTTRQNVVDIPTSERLARTGPKIDFIAIGAGAIHGAEIRGIFEG